MHTHSRPSWPAAVGLLITTLALAPAWARNDNAAEQARLDAVCEAAREQKLAPQRAKFVEECVAKGDRDRAGCERYYADFGNRSGGRAPLYYDLPECEEAFRFGRGTSRH